MKKMIISTVLVFALLIGFAACSKGDEPGAKKTVYDTLNALSEQSYSKIQLNITSLTGDIELKANYVLTANNVTYSIEQLNLLVPDGDLSDTSSDYKTTIQGTATVENGKVIKLDGETVDLPEYDELKGAFDFKESYFKNVQVENGKFSADVVSATAFLGTNQNLSNVKLIVAYQESGFEKITITYQTANSTVTVEYKFEK